MRKEQHTPEQISAKLPEAEVALSEGKTVPEARRNLGVTKQIYYRWRKEFGGLEVGLSPRRFYKTRNPRRALDDAPRAQIS